jgi:hypothetical protein
MRPPSRRQPLRPARWRSALLFALLGVSLIGIAAAAPKPAKTLNSQSSVEAQQARRSLLKQRLQSLGGAKHVPAKTIGASRQPGKTIVGHANASH